MSHPSLIHIVWLYQKKLVASNGGFLADLLTSYFATISFFLATFLHLVLTLLPKPRRRYSTGGKQWIQLRTFYYVLYTVEENYGRGKIVLKFKGLPNQPTNERTHFGKKTVHVQHTQHHHLPSFPLFHCMDFLSNREREIVLQNSCPYSFRSLAVYV